MENLNNLAVTQETQETKTGTEVCPVVKSVKCKPLQGTLNRTIARATNILAINEHTPKRFTRNYETGTASYTCPKCGCTAVVDAKTKTIDGAALVSICGQSNS